MFCCLWPTTFGFSQNMEGAVEISSLLKDLSPNIKILFVGGHVAALPKQT